MSDSSTPDNVTPDSMTVERFGGDVWHQNTNASPERLLFVAEKIGEWLRELGDEPLEVARGEPPLPDN